MVRNTVLRAQDCKIEESLVVQDNQLYIIKEGVKYDVLGVKL